MTLNKYLLVLFLGLTLGFVSCDKDDDDDHGSGDPEYHAHIVSPNADNKKVDDVIDIEVNFEDHNEGTVHHVKVRIYNEATGVEIYNKPDVAHVFADKEYNFTDQFTLAVEAHTDWILEAKVWGHEAGSAEVIEEVKFHVHPK